MTRGRVLLVVAVVVVLVGGLLTWRAVRGPEPSAREQYRDRLVAAAGVGSVRWSYTGSSVAVVRLHPTASTSQVARVMTLAGRHPCCQAVLYDGSARMEVRDRARTRFADLLVRLGHVDGPGVVTVPAQLPNLVTVSVGADPQVFTATQRLLSAGSDRLDALLVQDPDQDIARFLVSGADLDQQGVRNRLGQVLSLAADPSLAVEQVDGSADHLTVRLHATDRADAAQRWRQAGVALAGHGVDQLQMRVGVGQNADAVLLGVPGSPFSSAKPAG